MMTVVAPIPLQRCTPTSRVQNSAKKHWQEGESSVLSTLSVLFFKKKKNGKIQNHMNKANEIKQCFTF
jgi:hypothetical protein